VATWTFFTVYQRYQPIGPELLIDPDFTEAFTKWDVTGRGSATINDGVLLLQVSEPGAGVAVRQSLAEPHRYRALQLSGELRSMDIRPGRRFWHKGRLVLISFDADQRMMEVAHVVADLVGTRPWAPYSQVFRIPEGAREVRAGAQMIGATGEMFIRSLSLREAVEQDEFGWYRGCGIALWALALFWAGFPCLLRLRRNWPRAVIMVLVMGIFLAALGPSEVKSSFQGAVLDGAEQLFQLLGADNASANFGLSSTSVSHGGHLLAFALLAFGMSWAHSRESRQRLLVGLLVTAAVTETLQFFVDGRSPLLTDFLIDGAGILLGVALFAPLRSCLSLGSSDRAPQ
jgi:hypothetical protein